MSPSLLGPRGSVASYELKFRVSEEVAEQVESWARENLAFDPHADSALDNAYRIHSLYLDTAALDVYHRMPTYRRRKYRLRRYGTEHGLYLERKTRKGDRVAKRRTPVPDSELERLRETTSNPEWGGYWFHRRLLGRGLGPACQISYDRVAHVGTSLEGPLRLTLDRDIYGAPTGSWDVAAPVKGLLLFPGQVVLELKYRAALPALFKQLLVEFNLSPQPASKYRHCIEVWGCNGQAKEVG